MTTSHKQRDPALELVTSDYTAMQSEATYRELENSYKHSDQYAWMLQQYPQLRFWSARCKPAELIGGDSNHQ